MLLTSLLLSVISTDARTTISGDPCARPWVFFDLGNTLIDTKTNDYNPMFYLKDVRGFEDGQLYKSSKEYLDALVQARYPVGALIDVPEEWGRNYPPEKPVLDARTAKIMRMMDFIDGKVPEDEASWKDPDEGAMDWSPFGFFKGEGPKRAFIGRLYLPKDNSERKHNHSPALFDRAVKAAAKAGCKAVYQGEVLDEMTLAEAAGMIPFHIGDTDPKHFYLPIAEIKSYVDRYKPGSWKP